MCGSRIALRMIPTGWAKTKGRACSSTMLELLEPKEESGVCRCRGIRICRRGLCRRIAKGSSIPCAMPARKSSGGPATIASRCGSPRRSRGSARMMCAMRCLRPGSFRRSHRLRRWWSAGRSGAAGWSSATDRWIDCITGVCYLGKHRGRDPRGSCSRWARSIAMSGGRGISKG